MNIFKNKLSLGLFLLIASIWVFLPLAAFVPMPLQVSAVITAVVSVAVGLVITIVGVVERFG